MGNTISLVANGFSGDIAEDSKTIDVTLIPDFRKADIERIRSVASLEGTSVLPVNIGYAINDFTNESYDEIAFHDESMIAVLRDEEGKFANVGYVEAIVRNVIRKRKKDGTLSKHRTGTISMTTSVGTWTARKSYWNFESARLYHLVDVIEEDMDPDDVNLAAELLVFYGTDTLYYKFDEPIPFSYSYYDYETADDMEEFYDCKNNICENTASIIALYRTPFGVLLEDDSSNNGTRFYILITDEKINDLFVL